MTALQVIWIISLYLWYQVYFVIIIVKFLVTILIIITYLRNIFWCWTVPLRNIYCYSPSLSIPFAWLWKWWWPWWNLKKMNVRSIVPILKALHIINFKNLVSKLFCSILSVCDQFQHDVEFKQEPVIIRSSSYIILNWYHVNNLKWITIINITVCVISDI